MAQGTEEKGDGPFEAQGKLKSAPTPATQSRYGVGVRVALFALRVYKAYLSVLFGGTCRFEPTCSQYAYQAIERFGVLRGVCLGTKRLLRCHPLSGKFGYDPVPEEWSESGSESTPAAADRILSRATTAKDGTGL